MARRCFSRRVNKLKSFLIKTLMRVFLAIHFDDGVVLAKRFLPVKTPMRSGDIR